MAANLILPNLYIGSKEALNTKWLVDNKIAGIISIGCDLPCEIKAARIIIDIKDKKSSHLSQYFNVINKFIDRYEKIGPVLVHCYMGISRSATAVIAYIMYKFKFSYIGAFKYVLS